jgi:hypothetical protein
VESDGGEGERCKGAEDPRCDMRLLPLGFIGEARFEITGNVSATCAEIRMLWVLRPRTLPAARRVPDCMI